MMVFQLQAPSHCCLLKALILIQLVSLSFLVISKQRDSLSGAVLKRDREDLQKDVQFL